MSSSPAGPPSAWPVRGPLLVRALSPIGELAWMLSWRVLTIVTSYCRRRAGDHLGDGTSVGDQLDGRRRAGPQRWSHPQGDLRRGGGSSSSQWSTLAS